MKVGVEIKEPQTSVIDRLRDVAALQKRVDDEVIITSLRIATVTAQEVPVDTGLLRNSYHVHHASLPPRNANPLPAPPDRVTAVVGSVLEYAPKIEGNGGRDQIGKGAFGSAYVQETNGFSQRVATIVKNYMDGK